MTLRNSMFVSAEGTVCLRGTIKGTSRTSCTPYNSIKDTFPEHHPIHGYARALRAQWEAKQPKEKPVNG